MNDAVAPWTRQLVRTLPAAAQLMIRRGRSALRGDDWAATIDRLRRREQTYLDETAASSRRLAGRRHFLFFAVQQVPPWLEVEYSLATALRLRGHDISGAICDGVVPLCEMMLGPRDRPPCDVCEAWHGRYEHAFGFDFARLSRFISLGDRQAAEEQVARSQDPLGAVVFKGVPVGRLAHRELQRYHRGFVFDPDADPALRQWVVSAMLLVTAAERLLDEAKPDAVVVSSGRALSSACLVAVAKQRGTEVVTWDTEPTFPDGLVFSRNDAAVLIPLDEAWPEASSQPLTCDQRDELTGFMQRWAAGDHWPSAPRRDLIRDPGSIRRQLGLRPDAPMVVAFGNSAWDMAAVDRDIGFGSMFDWLFALVRYAKHHPEIDLVVRAHPSETNVPDDLRSRTPVCAEIASRAGPLPPNVALVDGDSAIDSYVLAEMAQVIAVYASRIGLEMAVRGRRPWLAGDTTYRGKGFTHDIASEEQMVARLDARDFDDRLTSVEIARAERFAHLWFFRYVARSPLLRPRERPFGLRSFRELGPGGDPVVEAICRAMDQGAPFLDLSAHR